MKPSPQTTPDLRTTRAAIVGALVALFALAAPVSAQSAPAVIGVVFDADGMGFTATSTKDISNLVVVDCAGDDHKHDGLTGLVFVHRETSEIAYVYVKSGSNANNDPQSPSGSGERFDNAGSCATSSSTSTTASASTTTTADSSTTTADSSTTTADSSTTTADSSTTTADSSTTDDNSTEVPFFTSGTALVLGFGGALAGTLVMLRRRL